MRISDDRIEVDVDDETGGIVAIRDLELGELLRDGSGGALFVLEVPRGGDRTVVIDTAAQSLTRHEHAADAVRLEWVDPVTSSGETLTGRLSASARVAGGSLELSFDHELPGVETEAVRFPVLPGITGPDESLEWRGVDYTTGTRVPLLPVFENNSPYWGTTYPDYASVNLRPEVLANPTSPFLILAGRTGGLTVQPARPTLDVIGWRASLRPGYRDSMRNTAGEARVWFEAIQFPVRGESVHDMTVTVYRGPWQAGTEPYRPRQRATRRGAAEWLQRPVSWLQVQTMSTEGEPRYDFAAVERIVAECAASGIGAIQITGWNEGGQDGLVPVHRPAEKLGGTEGLRRALATAREAGVKTVLYAKYQWVERPGPSWEELAGDVCLDVNGQPYAQPGPVYHSARKRYGMSTPWYVPLCFSSTRLRERFAAEVAQMAEWGADGVLLDESLYHGRALLCFAEHHGHPPGASAFAWDGEIVEELRRAAHALSEDFIIVGEGCYDEQFAHYDASYFRSFSPSHIPAGRLLRPVAPIVTALTGFDDRSMVNQALLHGYGLSFEPYNFKGTPADMPRTVAYGVAMDRTRTALAPWLWRGELVPGGIGAGTDGRAGIAVETVAGAPYERTAVWRATDRGGHCLVIDNPEDEPITVRVAGLRPALAVSADGESRPFSGEGLEVPPRTAVVVGDAPVAAEWGSEASSP